MYIKILFTKTKSYITIRNVSAILREEEDIMATVDNVATLLSLLLSDVF